MDLVVIRGPDIAIQALAGGSLEIAGSGADAPITAVERGLDLVMIGGLNNGLSHSLMGGKKIQELRRSARSNPRGFQSDFGSDICLEAGPKEQRS